MKNPRHIAVIDIGKTNAKLALVDLQNHREIAVLTRPNTVLPGPPWRHFDTDGHWDFLLAALKVLHGEHGIDAISISTHGASVVLLDAQGDLAAPVLDYEHPIPADIAQAYDAIRPPFAQTGSARLANGLNVGAQLFYQFAQDPGLRDRTRHIVGYPQYWGHRLTGEFAWDVTSIGCHTDLWEPVTGRFSSLVDRLGIAEKLAPVRHCADVLGSILPEVAAATGLSADTPVTVGIHDSNASLYPHLLTQEAPFSVVSTGTWVVAMAVGSKVPGLDPTRDTLVNVNAMGQPVPSARFMGGREHEVIQAGQPCPPTPQDVAQVLADSVMILPAVEPASGPFQGRKMRWSGPEPAPGTGPRSAALSFYLALMTSTCLALIAARGVTIVEGPFAQNREFKSMLSVATGRAVLHSQSATGTSMGASLLFSSDRTPPLPQTNVSEEDAQAYRTYAKEWHQQIT
ncbi:carbohydrate kinase [Roseobacter denitrificans]|uniref:Carbohydrate kinases, putative n=1 Tax=Roseobacter denitrificans (strain ATCC 33942 / OCh 114) TaxID=375451 RepID=Q164K7_ROSDO|nr:FGGY-family carbohydrate kinase [Roseobacter denitrificans]ABG32586.1 carbohydrate kinases, putative [Roseobacter denitrificans OCh 114]AVL52029.1 carbohydrate kinase [Roseobacter denitrificans]SFF92551.1 Sugar (pentulose or hexulose) kinase [Roseobacter denitrificans OCh 114]